MHYIRLLRPPSILRSPRGMQATLVLTITTDLGDAFLCPPEAVDLVVTAEMHSSSEPSSCELRASRALQWLPGARVAKPVYELPPAVARALAAGLPVDLCVATASSALSADGLRHILEASAAGAGLVMPVRVALNGDGDVSVRRLYLGDGGPCLEVEEEIGESIARHIWDAGVMALAALAAGPWMQVLRRTLDDGGTPANMLELGCGVGILGIGLAAVLARGDGAQDRTILMTDLAEAEARAASNMARLTTQPPCRPGTPRTLYENLDWEHGRRGCFGPQVRRRPWRLVVLSDCTYNADALPALVGSLSALHAHNASLAARPTRVFLATKPRHASERVFLGLMASEGWATLETQSLPLPVLGGDTQVVDLYLFEKD